MTQEIQWGPAIAVDGKRPGWLKDYDKCLPHWEGEGWYDEDEGSDGDCVTGWSKVTMIRLPADHPHYRQAEATIPEGMKAWHGGDAAPADWDGGPVLFRENGLNNQRAIVGDGPLCWQHLPHAGVFDIIAYTPKAALQEAPIDWSGELEAVHEDGRVVRVTRLPSPLGTYHVDPTLEDGWFAFDCDGQHVADHCLWRIRNVPQSTPQADTKPDLTARAPCMTISEVREMVAKGEDAVIATMLERGYALPEPVDEDLLEARKLAHEFVGDLTGWQGILEGKHDSSPAITQLIAAIKRGRTLALAGEKEA